MQEVPHDLRTVGRQNGLRMELEISAVTAMRFAVFANSLKRANDGCKVIIFCTPSAMIRRIESFAHRRD